MRGQAQNDGQGYAENKKKEWVTERREQENVYEKKQRNKEK